MLLGIISLNFKVVVENKAKDNLKVINIGIRLA